MEGHSDMGSEVLLDPKEGRDSHARKVLGPDNGRCPPQLKLGLNSHYETVRGWKCHSTVSFRIRDLGEGNE